MMSKKPVIKGLYAITPDGLYTEELLRRVKFALLGGASVLQYRNKTANQKLCIEQALALRELTREFAIPLIINDDVELAQLVTADGVHLGTDDATIAEVQVRLGQDKLIGASCYNRLELALNAVKQGADYVAFGAFFQSEVKPNAAKADVLLLNKARAALQVPIVAIGGITYQNGAALVDAGADALAVISALWNAPDVESAAKDFSKLFEQGKKA
jgi:thiamine-phosphate pyrophosphorylase